MTDKEQIMIDVNKCKYRDSYTNFCLAEKDDIGETYTICTGTDCYFKQLARKTQECEELKNEYGKLEQDNDFLAEKNSRLKGCLAEIKEIAEENIRIADLEGLNGVYRRGLAKQILQKISEVVE